MSTYIYLVLISKFAIFPYHRQCRVADYGHFSLSALLQTLPHIVQIMGAAQNRVLTLSHRAQVIIFSFILYLFYL